MATHTHTLIGGLDIGNGYEKGVITSATLPGQVDEIDIPSGAMLVTRPNQLPTPDEDAPEVVGGDFFNELDVSFVSPLVGDQYRRLLGVRGLSAKGSFEEFDVVGRRSKAEQELSRILVMGSFAGKALRDYVSATGALPGASDVLEVVAHAALALPITEYMAHRKPYADTFKGEVHTVTIHNFETPVTVKLRFESVAVIAEGASAQYAITAKGADLVDFMLRDVRAHGVALEGVTAQDVLAAENTVGIDVGEGTVNFPVFTNGEFNADASTTFSKGYGSVLTSALEAMEDRGYSAGFTSRKQLAEFLQRGPRPLKQNVYTRVSQFVAEEVEFFSREVSEHLGRVLAVVGTQTEVIYVYGGGSGPLKAALYDKLLAKVSEMNGLDAIPVLYLDSRYSRHLNREGLFIAAQTGAQRAGTKKPRARQK